MLTAPQPDPQLTAVRLRALLPHAEFLLDDDLQVHTITEYSGDCRPGTMFAAIPGSQQNGQDFVAAAIQNGATALLVDRPAKEASVPQCIVPHVREAYALICAALNGNPSHSLQVAGITGTNGKTTVTWLTRAILRKAGFRCGLLGTVEYDDGVASAPSALTTPNSQCFSNWLARMVRHRTSHAAVELSSHALHQHRVAGTQLAAAAITNITQDHFDYHHDFSQYQASKAKIHELLKPGAAIALNADDPGSWAVRSFLSSATPLLSFGWKQPADVSARIVSESLTGMQFRLSLHGETVMCETSMIGRHNLENCLAAAAVCSALGISTQMIATAIHEFRGAPGRLERIRCGQRFEVFVDYAHTDDALRRCLQSLRAITPGRVLCVFGAGGDRDRGKRPLLGAAAQLADVPIVTSDNPRSEDPERIAAEIMTGLSSTGPQAVIELDRSQAIRWAIQHADPADSILIAGKGHECEQIFRHHRLPFDDRAVARQALTELLSDRPDSLRIGA